MRIQKLLATGLFIIMSLGVFAQGFEGSIYFTKSNMVDVTQYVYHVKDDMVRIDEMVEGSDNLVATLLVNLESGDMIALSHERNLYMKRPADREVMYWVSDDADYDFFPKLLSILKRKDNFSTYYMSIPEVGNKLPLLAQENTLLREKKGFLQVDKLEKKTLDDSLFKIPAGFEKVER